jgi:hypothetical protein
MSRIPHFVPNCARLAPLTDGVLAALSALISLSRSKMRDLTDSNACSNSGSVKRGVMCCGQFKPEQVLETISRGKGLSVEAGSTTRHDTVVADTGDLGW